MVGFRDRHPVIQEIMAAVVYRRREKVRRSALGACQRAGLHRHVPDRDSPLFLDQPCVELVEATGDVCPITPPYGHTLMAFRECYLMLLEGYGYKNARVRMQRLCTKGWTWKDWCEHHITRAYWSVLAAALAIGAPVAVEAQGVFYAEHEPGIGLTTELAGGRGFDETLVVDLYFHARAREDSDLMTEVIHPGNRSKRTRVFAVDRGIGPADASVERCRVVERASVCHALAWWRVPVADNLMVDFHHAGVWNRPDGVRGEFHALWDVAAEVAVGGVSYLVGYQKGGAPPLFLPIETTRAGLSFAVGR